MKRHLLLLLGLYLCSPFSSFSQCTDCIPDLTCTSEIDFPTLCPEVLPDATAGEEYETVLTFYLPAELEDPESGLLVSLVAVTINQVSGLPFGLTFQLSEEDNTYNPGEGQQYGCATVCGTPLLPGEYLVTVFVTATVQLFGISQSVDESFSQALTVLPGGLGNPSFSLDNFASCGILEVNAEALIDGAPGITTYSWDLGNGEQSESVSPQAVYSEPGDYTISLTTSISNFNLESISVASFQQSWSGDIEEPTSGFAPDPYFIITDGNGVTVLTGPTISDVFSANWNNINLALDNPPYTIAFYDEDSISADDFLGSGEFGTAIGVNNFSAGGTSGFVVVGLTAGPVFENSEIVSVFPSPNAEMVFDELGPSLSLNDPDLDSFTWFFMGDTIPGENQSVLTLDEPGVYYAAVTNVFGCSGQTEEFVLCPSPTIVFNEADDVLITQPGNTSYQWFYNGLPVIDSNSNTIPFQGLGNYAVEVSTDYGCQEESSVFILSTNLNELENTIEFELYPNPTRDQAWITIIRSNFSAVTLRIIDIQGRVVIEQALLSMNEKARIELPIQGLNAGAYLVQLQSGHSIANRRLIIQP